MKLPLPQSGIRSSVLLCAVVLMPACLVRADVNDTSGWYPYRGGKTALAGERAGSSRS
jgi:hypothetical protein